MTWVLLGLREIHFFVFMILGHGWKLAQWRNGSLLVLFPLCDRHHVILGIPFPKILCQQSRYTPNVPMLINICVFCSRDRYFLKKRVSIYISYTVMRACVCVCLCLACFLTLWPYICTCVPRCSPSHVRMTISHGSVPYRFQWGRPKFLEWQLRC